MTESEGKEWKRLALGLARASRLVPSTLRHLAEGAYDPHFNPGVYRQAYREECRRADRIRRWLREIREAKGR